MCVFYPWLPRVVINNSSQAQEMEGKGPGFHCLHMRLIAVEFHRHYGPSIYVCDVKTDAQHYVVHTLTHVS